TTAGGGSSGNGTVFRMKPNGDLKTLANFNGTNGSAPHGFMRASDGNFYGTTYLGGTSGNGTVFKMTPTGTLTALVQFNNTNGRRPLAPVIQASDGNFYGTTQSGGAFDFGTVFRMTPTGTLTTLVTFIISGSGSNGSNPIGAVVQASDGLLYGTTSGGGTANYGTVFKWAL
ncbi:MAG: choice-of-anchor tandem repeat GloVer-containing protein, partial [Thermosynechococcaceae cyanobacterium]